MEPKNIAVGDKSSHIELRDVRRCNSFETNFPEEIKTKTLIFFPIGLLFFFFLFFFFFSKPHDPPVSLTPRIVSRGDYYIKN